MKNQFHLSLFLLFVSISLVAALILFVFFLPSSLKTQKTLPLKTTPTPNLERHQSISPNPSAIPQMRSIKLLPTPTTTLLTNPNKQQLISLMPIKTSGYTIEYLSTSDTFVVRILKLPYQSNKTAAENWFKTHGAEDLKTLNILYYQYRFVH